MCLHNVEDLGIEMNPLQTLTITRNVAKMNFLKLILTS